LRFTIDIVGSASNAARRIRCRADDINRESQVDGVEAMIPGGV